jgi:hypothetical protein
VKHGAETAVHAARSYITNFGLGEAQLKIDFANDLNRNNRNEVFSSTANYAPELLPFIDVSYGQPTFLCYGDYVIMSEVGLQHGDLLSPTSYYTSNRRCYKALKQTTGSGTWTMEL